MSSPLEIQSKDSKSKAASNGGGSPQSTDSATECNEAEQRRKISENLARVKLVMQGAQEIPRGCRIINGKPWKSITEEKEVNTNRLNSYPDILDQLKHQRLPGTGQNPNSRHRTERQSEVVRVDISPEKINQYYLGHDYAPVDTTSYDEKAINKENQRPWWPLS
ncbi:hypothetical protein HAX54_052168 [Datura stramonium]|uniref:Uncharacterized protein n=1 Tax=Datura stramonium TaxID=4076 RepID=A0ABS8T0C7_DATST|nr:hypothetical protein [Datura stramonium]